MRFNLGDKVRLIKTNEVGVIRSFECTYDPYRELDYKYTIDVESFFLQLYNRIVQIHDNHPFRTNNEVICYDENEMELVEKCNKRFYGGCELINNEEVKEVAKVNRFKIGDKVKVIVEPHGDREVGEIGTVSNITTRYESPSCEVIFEKESKYGYFAKWLYEHQLELTVETKETAIKEINKEFKFKIGNKVRILGDGGGYPYREVGEVGVIIDIDCDNSVYKVQFETADRDGDYELAFDKEYLELVNNNKNTSELTNIEANHKPTINTQEHKLPNELDDLDIELFEYLQSEIDSDNFNYLDKLIG